MPSHAPGLGHGLEGADQQLAGVFLVVGAFVGTRTHRHVARQVRDRLGDDVEMLGRMERDVDADRAAELARPHAGGDHDRVGRGSCPASVSTPIALPFSTRMRVDLGVLEDPARRACGRPWPAPG